MTPDAIIIFPGGVVLLPDGSSRSTTYEEGDAFGTLGGRDRVEAAAVLAEKFPGAYLVTTSAVYAAELAMLGVAQERILEGGNSSNTQAGVSVALSLAQEKGWKHMLFVSSGFHGPRIEAFYEQAKSPVAATFVSSESVLAPKDPAFAEYFEKAKKSTDYQKRLSAEEQGLEAIKKGTYRPAPTEDKNEQ